PTIQSQREALFAFQDTHPEIALEYTGLGAADYQARVRGEREAGQYLWDVYVSGITSTVFTQHIPAGWYDPLRPALVRPETTDDSKWLGGFDAGFLDRGRQYAFAFSTRIQDNVRINRDLVPEADLNSADDLLKPQFRDKITILDPRGPSAG